MRIYRRSLLLARHEVTYGTPPTFDPTTDAIKTVGVPEITFPHDFIDRDIVRPTLGRTLSDVANLHAQLRFTVEVAGGGMSGTNVVEPRIGRLIESCLFAKSTTDDGTGNIIEYVYTPATGVIGSDVPSIAFELYLAGGESGNIDKIVLAACAGTFRFTGTVGRYAQIEFTFTGKLYQAPQTVTLPTYEYESTKPPVFRGANFTFDTLNNLCVNELTIDIGNTVALRQCFGESDGIKGATVTNRSITGTIDPEAILQSDYDIFNKWANSNTLSMSMTVGSEQGNQFEIGANKVQIEELSYAETDGVMRQNVSLVFAEEDDGDFKIIFK